MKDIFGITLEVGQTVAACVQPGRASYELVPGKVVGFTPCMVRISCKKHTYFDKEPKNYLISPYKLAVVNP